MSKALTKDAILGVKDRELKKVKVPEWGGFVFLRELSGKERFDLQNRMVEIAEAARKKGLKDDEELGVEIVKGGARGELLTRCLCDQDGDLLFKAEDIFRLEEKNNNVIQRLFDLASEMNGMSDDEVNEEEKKAAKN